ncbi:MAG: hypothetical protein B7Y39_19315 [Bdellovibrio sp. 28-41-41]|nr:MAG: hypothetical protein B7Y39_19315 [Bdellovibrio sp. 28-41-41]
MKLSHILVNLCLILFFSTQVNAKFDSSNSSKTPSSAFLFSKPESPQMSKDPNINTGNLQNFTNNSTDTSPAPAASTDTNSGAGTQAAAGAGSNAATNDKMEANKPAPPIIAQLAPCDTMASTIGKTLTQYCTNVKTAAKECTAKYQTSADMCNTDTNPNLLSTMTQIQAMMSAVQGSGLTDSCSAFSKIMNIGKLGMAAYTTVCGVQQKLCDVACSKAVSAIEALDGAVAQILPKLATCVAEGMATPPNPEAGACKTDQGTISGLITDALKTEKTPTNSTVAGKTKVCKVDMLSLMGMGLMNVLSLAQAKGVSDQCEKDTAAADAAKAAEQACTNVANKDRADCACTIAANKTLSYCATGLVDCGLSENADKPLCICKANPRMSGCEGVSTSLATNSTLNTGNGSGLSTSRNPGSLTGTPSTAADATNLFPNKKGNGQDGVGSAAGAGGASGAGLSGDSAGGGATDKAAAAAAASKDSANILEFGGGGGGGRGFGSTYTSPEYRSKLKAFADRNGIGSKIAGSGWGDQVTATGGKSNFDKVKTRYQENKSTLLAK